MRTTSFFLLIVAVCLFISFVVVKPIGIFQDSLDIGKPNTALLIKTAVEMQFID